jgi:hypothetical protein
MIRSRSGEVVSEKEEEKEGEDEEEEEQEELTILFLLSSSFSQGFSLHSFRSLRDVGVESVERDNTE